MFNEELKDLLVFVFLFGVLLSFLIVFIIIVTKHYQETMRSNNKNIDLLKSLHENELIKSQLEIQEHTFQTISQEIHDNIGQKLSLAKLNLNRLDFDHLGDNEGSIDLTIQILTDVITDLRDLSRAMSSEVVMQNGLIKALELEIGQLNRAGMYNLRMQVIGESFFLDAKKELLLFRIVQECINNIIKHANATEICIRLHYKYDTLILEVEDNGKGFDMENIEKYGNGLHNIRKRASMLSGLSQIESSSGKGTKIHIQIPINGEEQSLEGHPGR